jgi:hypothetical protein
MQVIIYNTINKFEILLIKSSINISIYLKYKNHYIYSKFEMAVYVS